MVRELYHPSTITMTAKIKAIITGATGMVGEGVLHECLAVESVLVINRKPCGITHPKLTEIIHADFFNLSAIAPLGSYNYSFTNFPMEIYQIP